MGYKIHDISIPKRLEIVLENLHHLSTDEQVHHFYPQTHFVDQQNFNNFTLVSMDQVSETFEVGSYGKSITGMKINITDDQLQQLKDIDTVVFDGVITQRLVDIAAERNVNYLVAARVSKAMKQPLKVKLMTFEEILA